MKLPDVKNLKENFYLHFFALFGAVFLFVGKPVPYANEYSYLLRLRNVYDPNYLAKDITFSTPTNEYWLFDHLFGLPAMFLSIEIVGWIGRIFCWTILLFALMRLGRRWKIPVWLISISIFLWLAVGQSIVADEWMFGGFEAKCAAYICLIFALDLFCDERDFLPAVLLGLSFAFHPVVGLWGIAAAVPAFLFVRRDFRRTLKISVIAGAFSLIGAIPLLQMRAESVIPTIENLKYFQLVRLPQHFDPFSWAASAVFLQFILSVFCLAVYFQSRKEKPLEFLTVFLTILGVFFAAGILFRMFELYELMKYTPTRLFAVFIPLFFFFYLGRAYKESILQKPLFAVLLLVIIFLSIWNTLPLRAFDQTRETYRVWTEQPDDTAQAFIWLKNNTPQDAVVIAPPWRYDFWHLSERAETVNLHKPVIADVGEWQSRLENLVGKDIPGKTREEAEIMKFYFDLEKETIDALAERYNAAYFVSESDYPYPVVFSKGAVKIYSIGKSN